MISFGLTVVVIVVLLTVFDVWELIMNSLGIAIVAGIVANMMFTGPWDIVVPIIIGVLWVAYKLNEFGGGSRGSDDGDWGGFDGD